MNYWKEFLPVYFYTFVATTLGVAASLTSAYSLATICLFVVAGLISWFFVEYALHRSFFHYHARSEFMKNLVYTMHLSHHDNPKGLDTLLASVYTSLPLATIYCLIIWMLTSWQIMSYMFAGLIIGYFAYEALHYQAHHYTPKSSILRYLKKYHMLHHHQTPEMRYGVTTPFIDYLFGTYLPVGHKVSVATSENLRKTS